MHFSAGINENWAVAP